ncbi:hypothetical protein [Enterococcus lemanii]|uniref:Uncharacterized protein n=1 Tax=Enterococcus lemanii TaxID=1159752 RepID=A0ABV9MX75_9ENTE|nr:hypothetical protein [Enterococcus lemanii]MBM7708115.1 hypothetical protein [Enterococcus lemanii]
MELLITLVVVIIAVRILIKASSFIFKLLILVALIFGLWYFRFDLIDQFDNLNQKFSFDNWFSTVFKVVQNIWDNVTNWFYQIF